MKTLPRRSVLTGLAAGSALALGGFPRFVQAQSAAPIKLGFQLHRTGIGAAYGRWYERTAGSTAARSRSCSKMTAPTPSAAPKWWRS